MRYIRSLENGRGADEEERAVDDISPVWNYQGQWKDQDKGDNKFNLYSNTTFHATNKTVRCDLIS